MIFIKNKAILIVDPKESLRESIDLMLREDFIIYQANDDTAAFDILNKISVDLILVSAAFSLKRSQLDILTAILSFENLKDTPCVLIADRYNAEIELRAFDMGVRDIFIKPFSATAILQRVKNILNIPFGISCSDKDDNVIADECTIVKNHLDSIISLTKSSVYQLTYSLSKLDVTYMNDNFYKLREIKKDDSTLNFAEYIHPHDFDRVINTLIDAMEKQLPLITWQNRIITSVGVKYLNCIAVIHNIDTGYVINITETDISQSLLLRAEIQKSNLRMQSLLDMLPEAMAVYEVTLPTNTRIVFANESLAYVLNSGKRKILSLLESNPFYGIHEDDLSLVMEAVSKVVCDLSNINVTTRIINSDNEYRWFNIKLTAIEQDSERVALFVFFEEANQLNTLADKDDITNLINKKALYRITTTHFIKNKIPYGCVYSITLNNFQAVIENFGAEFSSKVLKEVGDSLKQVFRGNDIVSRLIDDEFCVFLSSAVSLEIINLRAKQVVDIVKRQYSNWRAKSDISASVGVAIAPKSGTDFDTLLEQARKARLDAFNTGDGCYKISSHTIL